MGRGSGVFNIFSESEEIKGYFLIVSLRVRSKAQRNTDTPRHNPAGRCHVIRFSRRVILKKCTSNTHTHTQSCSYLYINGTHRAEERDRHSDVTWPPRFQPTVSLTLQLHTTVFWRQNCIQTCKWFAFADLHIKKERTVSSPPLVVVIFSL